MKRMYKLPDSWAQATLSLAMQKSSAPTMALEVVISYSEAWEISTVVPREKLPNPNSIQNRGRGLDKVHDVLRWCIR